jgi:hypothetical protein
MEPQARRDQLVSQPVGDELVVYDERRQVAHHLNRPAAMVWKLADGHRTIVDLTAALEEAFGASVDESVVYAALEQLHEANLLTSGLLPEMERISRRKLIATLATILPMVASIKVEAACMWTANPAAVPSPVDEAGGSFPIYVTGSNYFSCIGQFWSASSAVPWMTVAPETGDSATTNLTVTVAANPGPQRQGTVTVAGTTITVTQAGTPLDCTSYTLSPNPPPPAPGTTATVTITVTGAPAGCGSSWTAVSNASFIHVTSGATGSGSGTVNLALDANPGTQRSGTVTIAGQTVNITQAGAAQPCGGTQVSGTDQADSRTIQLGKTGQTTFTYQTYSQQDRIVVYYKNQPIFDTGCVGASGSQVLTLSGPETYVVVEVTPNCAGGSGTAWNYSFTCPP